MVGNMNLLKWDVLICIYTHMHGLWSRRCILPGRSIAGGHRNRRGRRTSADNVFFLSKSPRFVQQNSLFVWHLLPFPTCVHWVDPAQLQAKRKDMVTNSKSSTHQCQLVGLQIQPAAGDGIVGGNQKKASGAAIRVIVAVVILCQNWVQKKIHAELGSI